MKAYRLWGKRKIKGKETARPNPTVWLSTRASRLSHLVPFELFHFRCLLQLPLNIVVSDYDDIERGEFEMVRKRKVKMTLQAGPPQAVPATDELVAWVHSWQGNARLRSEMKCVSKKMKTKTKLDARWKPTGRKLKRSWKFQWGG